MARLDGKVALITGAGTGIGRATARAMAAEGAKVVVAEIIAEAGEQTAQIVAQAGGDCIAVATDVPQEDSVSAAVDAAVRHYGGLHTLHNNAGGSTPVDSTVVEVPIEEFWRAIRPRSVWHVSRLPLRHTSDHRLGRRIGDQHGIERGADGGCRPGLLHRRERRHRRNHTFDGG